MVFKWLELYFLLLDSHFPSSFCRENSFISNKHGAKLQFLFTSARSIEINFSKNILKLFNFLTNFYARSAFFGHCWN